MRDFFNTLIIKCRNKYESIRKEMALLRGKVRYPVKVMSAKRTINYVLKHKCSVSRYGDGELNMLLIGKDIGFQKYEEGLSLQLKETLSIADRDLLICLPHTFRRFYGENLRAKEFWKGFLKKNRQSIYLMLKDKGAEKYYFGDTQMTRPYMDYDSKKRTRAIYDGLKKLWRDRNIVIVEGTETRMGVGNDLFANAKSIKRILCPSTNAYRSYDEIKAAIVKHVTDQLILLALGPTATVLAADLAKMGYWAIDVGHIDVEYEWYLKGAKEKCAISGKYVNEVADGNAVENCTDEEYSNQILTLI